jgi:hypothetical protein
MTGGSVKRKIGVATACMVTLATVSLAAAAGKAAAAEKSVAAEKNGFALEPASIDVAEILAGGPPRDGIPALDAPKTLAAADAPWEDDERVIGVALGGEARAYPLAVLVWHELVNDTLGGHPILVSYCPLCGTGIVFDRRIAGKTRRFGVSGLLYRSDLLLYDRETESLWSQISAEAVTGASRGARLELIRGDVTTWGAWQAAHPKSRVLSRETGHRRPYGESAYLGYAQSKKLLFPVPTDDRYHPKMPTVGLRIAGGAARAYPAEEVLRAGGEVRERFAGHAVRIAYDEEDGLFRVEAPAEVEVIEGYWFAWAAFHGETEVFTAPGVRPRAEP